MLSRHAGSQVQSYSCFLWFQLISLSRPGVKASFGLALDTQKLNDTSPTGAAHKVVPLSTLVASTHFVDRLVPALLSKDRYHLSLAIHMLFLQH